MRTATDNETRRSLASLSLARDDKNKELATAQLKLRPFKTSRNQLFQQPIRAAPFDL
jgi:hypothetical protein